jgi:hypothetical protein
MNFKRKAPQTLDRELAEVSYNPATRYDCAAPITVASFMQLLALGISLLLAGAA